MFSLGLWVTVTGELEALASRPVCELYKDGTFLSPLDLPTTCGIGVSLTFLMSERLIPGINPMF